METTETTQTVPAAEPPEDAQRLRKAVETLLFIADQPVPLSKICSAVGEKDSEKIVGVIADIRREWEERGSAVQVLEIAEGFQMATRPEYAFYVRKLYSEKMTMRLSTAALETLAIVAYKQPLTRAEIEEIRGVEVIAALETLLEKRLLKVVGRKETVGRPLLYGTSPEFLRHFGLRSLADLPPIDTFTPPDAAQDSGQAASAQAPVDGPQGPFASATDLAEIAQEQAAQEPQKDLAQEDSRQAEPRSPEPTIDSDAQEGEEHRD